MGQMDSTVLKEECIPMQESHPFIPSGSIPPILHVGSDVALQLYTDCRGGVRLTLSSYLCDVSDFKFIGKLLKLIE